MDHLTDKQAALVHEIQRRFDEAYRLMNLYATYPYDMGESGRVARTLPTDILAEVYFILAPVPAILRDLQEGVNISDVMKNMIETISSELAEERDSIDATRSNLEDEYVGMHEHYIAMERKLEERDRQRELAIEQRVEWQVANRLAHELAKRDEAARIIRSNRPKRKLGM